MKQNKKQTISRFACKNKRDFLLNLQHELDSLDYVEVVKNKLQVADPSKELVLKSLIFLMKK